MNHEQPKICQNPALNFKQQKPGKKNPPTIASFCERVGQELLPVIDWESRPVHHIMIDVNPQNSDHVGGDHGSKTLAPMSHMSLDII